MLNGKIELAFDHLQIVRDAIERVRVELEVTGIATAFVGATFTLAELRAVYEAVWGVQLDAANFRRSVVAGGRLGDPDRPPRAAGPGRRQARGALPRGAGLEPRRADPSPAANARRRRKMTMRAVVHDRYGPPEVLRLEEVERPVPEDDEVLVEVHATTVNRTDCGLRSAEPFFTRFFTGLRRPKRRILGMELAGEVEAVGAAVTEFEVGDEVFGVKGFGANAEYVCVRESGALAHKPAGMSFEEAAAVCDGAIIALACLRKADLREGRSIVVYGASGSIGTAAVQLAKHFGAHVTAVCNTKNVELVRSLGADEVDRLHAGRLHEERRDVRRRLRRGRQALVQALRRSLKPGGIYIDTDLGFMWHVPALALLTRWIGDKRVTLGDRRSTRRRTSSSSRSSSRPAKYRAVIDRRYPLEDVVEATRYVETGQKTGNVVLTVYGSPGG